MRKPLVVTIKDKKTEEIKKYSPVYDIGHFWDSENQYFSVFVGENKIEAKRIVLEPKHDFVITITD